MKANHWLIFLVALIAIVGGLFVFLIACNNGDDDDDNDAKDEEPLPECEYEYSPSPGCSDTAEVNGLEWTVCDNGEDIDQYCAMHYAAGLDVGGKSDWRLPTVAELSALYDAESQQNVDCENLPVFITTPFQLTCGTVWSGELTTEPGIGDAAKYFSFFLDGTVLAIEREHRPKMRVLAVRDL
jgi:hypothetical protein